MTFLGYIILVLVILGFLGLLGEGIKSGLNISRWSDLWRSSDRKKQDENTFRVHITGTFNIHTPEPGKQDKAV